MDGSLSLRCLSLSPLLSLKISSKIQKSWGGGREERKQSSRVCFLTPWLKKLFIVAQKSLLFFLLMKLYLLLGKI